MVIDPGNFNEEDQGPPSKNYLSLRMNSNTKIAFVIS